MTFNWIKYSGIAVLVILLQVLVFNHVLFQSYMNPYLYLVLLLMLPKALPKQGALFLGFMIGLIIDFFTDSAGLHAGACTLVMLIRSYLVNIIKTKEDYEPHQGINVHRIGFQSYVMYAGLLLFILHLYIFTLEYFTLNHFFSNILKAFLSSLLSLVLILLSQYLFIQSKNR